MKESNVVWLSVSPSCPHDCIMNKCARKMTKRVQCQGIVTMLVNCIITYGWFQKISIPYHGWHEYFNPPLPSEILKCLSPPCPPNSKIANSPSLPEFSTFVSDPTNITANIWTGNSFSIHRVSFVIDQVSLCWCFWPHVDLWPVIRNFDFTELTIFFLMTNVWKS